jgi:hypothetical protein
LKSPRNRPRGRIQTLVRPQTIFPFLKVQRENWSCSVSASTAVKSAEQRAPAAMVIAVRALPWGLI